ncbi:MAG: hypothetical protein COS14_04440 [Bacteroidetes bacterium CG02_land_8_20_14_3_00_31_25]|nr:DUF4160 domain-containing protein [Bacteroidota bacterium]PIV60934.1 MAG: hypothetical protein COS14_04440 [Bacteroidetes bacterium CG02_land_8_20_14_3_00_31_25]PIX35774.1 MAG: hypothetical protein COZ59_04635 [Bacteroidetes bacterium CG_4_8_14_3_um_filter_31_14]PIY02180.1 MAG: hypothetical protein COZ21_15505 [Bacteroidetes bacterium CG_4_10_14_3_um_filter_31_20]
MPKILIYKNIWIFIIYSTDVYEKRKHIHVGKRGMKNLCKIWLEPKVGIANPGNLTVKQQNELLEVTKQYRKELIAQWINLINGNTIEIIKIK